jgi:hypothetical protein
MLYGAALRTKLSIYTVLQTLTCCILMLHLLHLLHLLHHSLHPHHHLR